MSLFVTNGCVYDNTHNKCVGHHLEYSDTGSPCLSIDRQIKFIFGTFLSLIMTTTSLQTIKVYL